MEPLVARQVFRLIAMRCSAREGSPVGDLRLRVSAGFGPDFPCLVTLLRFSVGDLLTAGQAAR
jgi:hypothetical protein